VAKAAADLRSLARAHTEHGIKVLSAIAQRSKSDAARVAAVALLLDRGWGKPPQTHTGEDGEGDIRVTIRHIIQGEPKHIIPGEPKLIENKDD